MNNEDFLWLYNMLEIICMNVVCFKNRTILNHHLKSINIYTFVEADSHINNKYTIIVIITKNKLSNYKNNNKTY